MSVSMRNHPRVGTSSHFRKICVRMVKCHQWKTLLPQNMILVDFVISIIHMETELIETELSML